MQLPYCVVHLRRHLLFRFQDDWGRFNADPQGVFIHVPLIGCIARKNVAGVSSVQDDNVELTACQMSRVR
jgi:hypothetical protein